MNIDHQRFWREVDKHLASMGQHRPWLARVSQVPIGRINNWAVRGTLPRLDEGLRIADTLRVSIRSLLTGEPDKKIDFPRDIQELVEAFDNLPSTDRQILRVACRALYRVVKDGSLSIPIQAERPVKW